jgi:hypothetical protein
MKNLFSFLILFVWLLNSEIGFCQNQQEKTLMSFSSKALNITWNSEGTFDCVIYKPTEVSQEIYARGGFSGNLVGKFDSLKVEMRKENEQTLLIRMKGVIDFSLQGDFRQGANADFALHIVVEDNKMTGVYHIGYIQQSYSYRNQVQMGTLIFYKL